MSRWFWLLSYGLDLFSWRKMQHTLHQSRYTLRGSGGSGSGGSGGFGGGSSGGSSSGSGSGVIEASRITGNEVLLTGDTVTILNALLVGSPIALGTSQQKFRSDRFKLKGRDDLQITERNSSVKRCSIEMKSLNSLDAGSWRKRMPQILGPLDDLGEKSEGELSIYKTGPYNSRDLLLLRVLRHVFNHIISTPTTLSASGENQDNIDDRSERDEDLSDTNYSENAECEEHTINNKLHRLPDHSLWIDKIIGWIDQQTA
ncbi:8733_t:CDS:2 [Paraglomus occultum]|uniref:8733_t:CDS:1 n=1 Tax=Paraglomus occultum TaxID=144539 RepID=A0A9N8VUZ1_9GLOM|nr:8733_t:CDS:2 [Paraglomus occultum]